MGNCLHHEPCPACGSRDNLARYEDMSAYCFGCGYHEKGAEDDGTVRPGSSHVGSSHGGHDRGYRSRMSLIPVTNFRALKKRKISARTCEKYGYFMARLPFDWKGHEEGETVAVSQYRDNGGAVVAQHVRFSNKDFMWLGDFKEAGLFGQHLFREGGRRVVVTEGEEDTMSIADIQDCKWPVVSIGCGAAKEEGIKKITQYIGRFVEWLSSFDEVVFCFDMDPQGQASARAAAAVLPHGKAFITHLPLKDASDMLQADRAGELSKALWDAKPYRPDTVVSVSELGEAIFEPAKMGTPWAWKGLTDLTFGRRLTELVAWGAGVGVGKTEVFAQQIAWDIENLDDPVAAIMLEQTNVKTVQAIASKMVGKRFNLPGVYSEDEYREAVNQLMKTDKLHMYRQGQPPRWDNVSATIRYFRHALGVRHVYLDHLTALMSHEQDERRGLDRIMAELANLALELEICVHFISHLTTPDGTPHEEGGRVMEKHFTGSRAIARWSHYMIGIERNKQADDPEERRTTTFRLLKAREVGDKTGEIVKVKYDLETGLLNEIDQFDQHFGGTQTNEQDDECPF